MMNTGHQLIWQLRVPNFGLFSHSEVCKPVKTATDLLNEYNHYLGKTKQTLGEMLLLNTLTHCT